jgi:serine/threonine protein kinase
MPSLPRFELSEIATGDTQVTTEPSLHSESWSGCPAPNVDELIGRTLSNTYVVEGVIGEGGMGRVYRASHTRISGKRYAIKVLRQEFTSNQELVARFLREAEAAACISHPNVVEVYDVDVTIDGQYYLVCEFLAGADLSDYLDHNGPLEPLRAVNLALQVCHGLSAAHDSGVIHRDLKPHNIFLIADEQGQIAKYPAIKVLDFGLSRFMDNTKTQLTRAGVIMGTPSYMSPEQARGETIDSRTDVYGAGAVLFAALAGRAPYEAESLQALVMAVMNGVPERLRDLAPDVPESLELIVERAMARNTAERYQNMQEFRSVLESYFAKAVAQPVETMSPIRLTSLVVELEPDDDDVKTARPRLIGTGALLVLLIAVAAATMVSSLEVVTGRLRLSHLEIVLLFLGLAGTLLTPLGLLFAKLRKTVWLNHTKVFQLLWRLRAATLSLLVAYGVVTLGLLVGDDVVGRVMTSSLLGHELGMGFRGFNAVLFVVAAIWVAVSLYLSATFPKSRERLRSVGVVVLGAVGSLLVLAGGLAFRSHFAPVVAAATATPSAAAMLPAAATATPSAAVSVAVSLPAPDPNSKSPKVAGPRAPVDELARATVKGTVALIPLAERFPEDPNVLRPLFFAFASRATGLVDAMAVARQLLIASPEDAMESDLRYLIRKAAASPGEASRLALDIMTDQMGATGADLLYEIWIGEPKAAKAAESRLSSEKVKRKISPALAIAIELRRANSCAARIPLLERAAGLGDLRSVAILSPLSASSKRGCGKWKRSPCAAVCASEARAYYEAITKIMERHPQGH